jgi:hypothetical protein
MKSTYKGTLVFEHDLPGAAVAIALCVTVITWVLVEVYGTTDVCVAVVWLANTVVVVVLAINGKCELQ